MSHPDRDSVAAFERTAKDLAELIDLHPHRLPTDGAALVQQLHALLPRASAAVTAEPAWWGG